MRDSGFRCRAYHRWVVVHVLNVAKANEPTGSILVNQFDKKPKPKRPVWRISQAHPEGRWIRVDSPTDDEPAKELPEVHSGGWITSSFDLLSGADVTDDPDTIPNALWDELFAKRDTPPDAEK